MSNPYAPIEPSNMVWEERYSLIGTALSLVAYGLLVAVFSQCCYLLVSKKARRCNDDRKRTWATAAYVFVMFALGSLFVFSTLHNIQVGLIDNRNFPGGPLAYWQGGLPLPLSVLPNACATISSWLADLLLLYRCFVIYNNRRWVLIFPILMFLADLTMACIMLYQASNPTGGGLDFGSPLNVGLAYFTIMISLNVVITTLITARILSHRRQFMRAFESSESDSESGSYSHSRVGEQYMGIAALLVESSALLAVAGLLFLGTYAAHNHASNVFLPILTQVQIIAPLLIIKRVMERRAWTTETADVTSVVESARHKPMRSRSRSLAQESDVTTTDDHFESPDRPLEPMVFTVNEKSQHKPFPSGHIV